MSKSITALRRLRRVKYTTLEEMATMASYSRLKLSVQDIAHIESSGHNPIRTAIRKTDAYLRMLGFRLDVRILQADEPIEPTDPLDQPIDPSGAEGYGDVGEHHR